MSNFNMDKTVIGVAAGMYTVVIINKLLFPENSSARLAVTAVASTLVIGRAVSNIAEEYKMKQMFEYHKPPFNTDSNFTDEFFKDSLSDNEHFKKLEDRLENDPFFKKPLNVDDEYF